jgi:hypothetical protein
MTQKERAHRTALDSAHRDGCDDRLNGRAESVWPWDDDPELTAAYMDGYHGREMSCARCRQQGITRREPNVCDTCRDRDREPQGEAVRLFQPAPEQLPGQLSL